MHEAHRRVFFARIAYNEMGNLEELSADKRALAASKDKDSGNSACVGSGH